MDTDVLSVSFAAHRPSAMHPVGKRSRAIDWHLATAGPEAGLELSKFGKRA